MSMSLGGLFGDHCGPPYADSMDHEFAPGSGSEPGTGPAYCEHCGVYQGMHGAGGGGDDAGGDSSGRGHWRDLLSS